MRPSQWSRAYVSRPSHPVESRSARITPAHLRARVLSLQVLGFEDIPRTKPRRRRHQRPSNATRHATSSFSTAQSGSFSNPNPYSNSNGGGPSHRRPSELEELRPTPEDDEAGPLYDPRLRSQFSPPPPPSSGSGRRGKAPPIPSQQLLSSSASSVTNPLISSRPRACRVALDGRW